MFTPLQRAEQRLADTRAAIANCLGRADAASDGLPDLEIGSTAHSNALETIAAQRANAEALRATLPRVNAEIEAARQSEKSAKDQTDLADFQRRTRRAAQRRPIQYQRLAGELAEMAREMVAERHEARVLRARGLQAQEAISHPVVDYLHLPAWERGHAELYCPAGTDRLALREAFLGRRPSQAPRLIVVAEEEGGE